MIVHFILSFKSFTLFKTNPFLILHLLMFWNSLGATNSIVYINEDNVCKYTPILYVTSLFWGLSAAVVSIKTKHFY